MSGATVQQTRSFLRQLLWAGFLTLFAAPPAVPAAEADATWQARLDPGVPGPLPPPRPFQANYRMRWTRVDAARAEVDFRPGPGPTEALTRVQASTLGMARSLWQLDATHLALARLADLRPLRMDQTETRPGRRDVYHVSFEGTAATRQHRRSQPPGAAEVPDGEDKSFDLPAMRDMNTAFLYLRSLPLLDGERHSFVVMTPKSPYLASVRVLRHGPVQVRAGRFPAVELELGLEKVDRDGRLKKHKLFKTARVWLSEDADRLPLKAEAQIFIGNVSMELEGLTHPVAPER